MQVLYLYLYNELSTLFIGLAKIGEDWLLRGEPLSHWLMARKNQVFMLQLIDDVVPLPKLGLLMRYFLSTDELHHH
jgi:hypothetical protein